MTWISWKKEKLHSDVDFELFALTFYYNSSGGGSSRDFIFSSVK
jgi:hypothetical protein